MANILIIKTGYSETLDSGISMTTSYGDVLRTTVLLHFYKDDHVTWVVDKTSYPILKDNGYIDHILQYDATSALQLQSKYFDVVINLEKDPGICAMANSIKALNRLGFYLDENNGEIGIHNSPKKVLSIFKDIEIKKNHNDFWQKHLFEIAGSIWEGQEYVLGYKPRSEEKYDIGFNYRVGIKWPSKTWPITYWEKLEKLIGGHYSISWQKGLDNIEDYFEWINSCRMIVTNDSFGAHLALAMKKKLLVLFGPTNFREFYFYGRGKYILPDKTVTCGKIPCHMSACAEKISCMNYILPETVLENIDAMFSEEKNKEYAANKNPGTI